MIAGTEFSALAAATSAGINNGMVAFSSPLSIA